jgi:hypothetical protein
MIGMNYHPPVGRFSSAGPGKLPELPGTNAFNLNLKTS